MIIERHPAAVACSSHQIHLPVPSSMAFRAIPCRIYPESNAAYQVRLLF
jgi:hypothetical protein